MAVVLETIHEPDALAAALTRAAEQDVVVVALTVGRSEAGKAMVTAHSGALAGSDAAWEALFDAHGVIRVQDLDEMTDTLELFCSTRRPATRPRGGGGVATVHDLVPKEPWPSISRPTSDCSSPASLRRPRASSRNFSTPASSHATPSICGVPVPIQQTGFAGRCWSSPNDPETDIVALSVDLVYEYDNDDSYERALFDARAETSKPLVLLSNLRSAIDPAAAARLREVGVPVLEGTRTGMLAMRHLLEWRNAKERSSPIAHPIDEKRRTRWSDRIRAGGLGGAESLELLADYGIRVTRTAQAKTREEALARSVEIGLPVVLKTDMPGIDHKSDVGGVLVGLETEVAVGRAYDDLASRLGPEVLVAEAVSDGVEVALGIVRDRSVGPIVMVGAGGVLVEYIADRSVSLPPVDIAGAAADDRVPCHQSLVGWNPWPRAL